MKVYYAQREQATIACTTIPGDRPISAGLHTK